MKTKLVTLKDFKGHPHPASKLFRVLELQTVYKQTRGITFKQPSMDLGWGDGYLSSILFDGKFTYNVDNGEANDLHIAKRHHRYKKILLESAENMSLKDNSLNFVFSNSVIEHIPNNEALLKEVSRVLKKGGNFIFTSPSHNFKEYLYLSDILKGTVLEPFGNWYKNKRNSLLNHYHTYSHSSWTRKLKRHGLIVKKYDYYISKENCMFWDRLALKVKIFKLFDKKAEDRVYKKYKTEIEKAIKCDDVTNNQGASLFIWATKI